METLPVGLDSKSSEKTKISSNVSAPGNILPWKTAPSPNNLQKSVKGRDSSGEVSDVQHDTAETLPTE
ncbi:sorting nexin carboxy-terminal protein, partial [Trifolium medium]|nr:sorting nexin carboxy-terminal protein [Trifolium medium]